MSYVRNWLHCVWGTINRFPFLTPDSKSIIIDHIRQNATKKFIYLDSINGHTEHLHCIISLHPDQCLSIVMQLIKGESSYWINKNRIIRQRFEWADEYYAVSVSESQLFGLLRSLYDNITYLCRSLITTIIRILHLRPCQIEVNSQLIKNLTFAKPSYIGRLSVFCNKNTQ